MLKVKPHVLLSHRVHELATVSLVMTPAVFSVILLFAYQYIFKEYGDDTMTEIFYRGKRLTLNHYFVKGCRDSLYPGI